MASLRTIARRTFLTGAAAIAGGLAVGYYYYRRDFPNPLLDSRADDEAVFNPYVKIDAAGKITVIAPRAEMGQGIATSLAALVAEELDVPLAMLTVEHGPASKAYHNGLLLEERAPYPDFDEGVGATAFRGFGKVMGKFLALQVTGGSTSTRDAFDKMRMAGAAAREMLKQAAANKLAVAAETLTTADGTITDPASGKSLTYGEVAADAAKLPMPSSVTLRDPSQWKILGTPQKRVDMVAKVTGAPVFGIDVSLPGMVHATVRMNPRLGGPMLSFDDAAARAVKGVIDVIELNTQFGHGYAVIASNTWSAFRAAAAVTAAWGEAPYPASSAGIGAVLAEAMANGEANVFRSFGDAPYFYDASSTKIEATYSVPFLAHATMEPMNATAQFKDGQLDVWSPTQVPTIVRNVCATALGIDEENVRVHTTMMGGGFGRRGETDFSLYAALIAARTGGKPVKVTWTREEDMTHDMYRPASIARFKASMGYIGVPSSLQVRIAAPSIAASVLARNYPSLPAMGADRSVADGSFNQPYFISHLRVETVEADLKVPVGFWRSAGYSANVFSFESFVDEMALLAKADPLSFRLLLTETFPVAQAVLKRVGEISGWYDPPAAGRAKGLAFSLNFGSWIAQVVEVAQTGSGIRIVKLWAVADLGTVLDPDNVKAQIVSGAVYGLSAAMGQEITFEDGKVAQSNFTGFDAMRMAQCPIFAVELLSNAPQMGGAGEIGTPPAAPALANAVFALTGKRIRQLPLSKDVRFA